MVILKKGRNEIVKKIIRKIFIAIGLKKPLLAYQLVFRKGFLTEYGFIRSWMQGFPVDKDGEYYPWWTYSFTNFISSRVNATTEIFEYGSGNSTIFLSKIVGNIVAVEHDKKWYETLRLMLNKNAELILVSKDDYVNSIKDHKYDVVIIDGLYRNECAFKCVYNLKEAGVIIFDDTDRSDYNPAYDYLRKNGFSRIDFTGLSPCSLNENSTSIFYRENNCLDI
ncbi:MAG: hypothetical protein CBC71_07030 [Rhodobacteraceae bacterium TMED111]|nr:MAG: hypothetical protein CBC71_07030 [Rhodobacteraceae bacterium TMED111]|tara:strand:+ start:5441 stop:6109 length:669 start_codon:yes stop_codon:yes gene_type:complete